MAHFDFLKAEWPEIFVDAAKAESLVHADPRTASFYGRRTLELLVNWAFKYDQSLRLPYQDNLSALIHEPTFRNFAGEAVFVKARMINTLGNRAVHTGGGAIDSRDATQSIQDLFHVCFWFAQVYAKGDRPAGDLRFDQTALSKTGPVPRQAVNILLKLKSELKEKDESLTLLLADKDAIDDELKTLRAEVAAAKVVNTAIPDVHDYSEEETRDYFIDFLLKESGWSLSQEQDREFEVNGMPTSSGKGFVDYVLWGDDGKPLGLVEAKRTRRSPIEGQQQAKLYADCLEAQFGQRPVIFYSNGYQHWMWDDQMYPPRELNGFYKQSELEYLIQQRTTRKSLATADIDDKIVERYYQTRAIRRISESFERDNQRQALLVMATGAGKTRTVIALSDLLMRCNWAKRILFLADRRALVKQAENAFKQHLPDSSPVNLINDKDGEGRVFVSTYPTMMGLIDESHDGQRRFGPGHFDLIVIDEAHRSVYQKYRAIFEYFDSFLVGLTATPKDEIDHNTYSLFGLEDGVPTDAYPLEDAVNDGYLVPFHPVSVPLKIVREGLTYEELPEAEKEQWDALDWGEEDSSVPDRVEAAEINKWLFNKDTVDRVLKHLMERGQKVAGGDRLGKTIIFAKNQSHAEFIAKRFDANYPEYKGDFARIITFKIEHSLDLIDKFSIADGDPNIAISVDMLDTGIDIPEVVNLVFFKIVRSKTKFWQMLGRGTRLRPNLFGPGDDKAFFYIFDYCMNLEFFSQDPIMFEGSTSESLSKRIFKGRLNLLQELDNIVDRTASGIREARARYVDPEDDTQVHADLKGMLVREVASMNIDNFIVRPKRQFVDKFGKPESWSNLSPSDYVELVDEVAGLPAELQGEKEEAKRFDMTMLSLQLAFLRKDHRYGQIQRHVRGVVGLLESGSLIPLIAAQLPLIQDMQTDEWWQDVNLPMLESARRRLRSLVQYIERSQRKPLYTDFADEMGEEGEVDFGELTSQSGLAKFKAKARAFLREHPDGDVIYKIRLGLPLTSADLDDLERVFVDEGIGTEDDVLQAMEESEGLGLFVRSLIGLDRKAAVEALGAFTSSRVLSGNQLTFIDMIVDDLTEHGVVEPGRLYDPPYSDVAPTGPEGLLGDEAVEELIEALQSVKQTAIGE